MWVVAESEVSGTKQLPSGGFASVIVLKRPCLWGIFWFLTIFRSFLFRFSPDSYCLSQFWLLQQNTIDWVSWKQQKFIPHSSGGWRSKVMVPTQLSSSKGPFPRCGLLASHCPHMVEGARAVCGDSLIRALTPFMRAPRSGCKHPPPSLAGLPSLLVLASWA